MENLADYIRAISLDNTDLLLVKDRELLKQLMNVRGLDLKRKISVIAVYDFDDIISLDEKQLNKAGWFKK